MGATPKHSLSVSSCATRLPRHFLVVHPLRAKMDFALDKEFLGSAKWMLEVDRRGNSDDCTLR